jgi:hypothetical protein
MTLRGFAADNSVYKSPVVYVLKYFGAGTAINSAITLQQLSRNVWQSVQISESFRHIQALVRGLECGFQHQGCLHGCASVSDPLCIDRCNVAFGQCLTRIPSAFDSPLF